MKMTSNGKTLKYKVIDLVESYNFHIKFTSIRVQKTDWTPTVVARGGSRCYSTTRVRNAMRHGGRSLTTSPTTLGV
jgi:hypothetical protein